jgi:hypothetical protein
VVPAITPFASPSPNPSVKIRINGLSLKQKGKQIIATFTGVNEQGVKVSGLRVFGRWQVGKKTIIRSSTSNKRGVVAISYTPSVKSRATVRFSIAAIQGAGLPQGSKPTNNPRMDIRFVPVG